jgi:hypothetical protein
MPKWYTTALASRQDSSTCITFAKDFLAAPPAERAEVVRSWDPRLHWALPSPWRLACEDDAPGSPIERIRTDLLFQALGISGVDARESIMGFAVVHNSCMLAGIDPHPVFEEIAVAVGGTAAQALRDFAGRDAEDQSMEAFMLEAVANPGGGYEIRGNW